MEFDLMIDPQPLGDRNRDTVYNTIKTNILNMRLAPGCPINESNISRALGVSRTPVRESFVRLSRDNLVVSYPQRGSFVTKIDMRLVNESIFMRSCLEKTVYKDAARRASPALISELKRCLYMQRTASRASAESALEFLRYDNEFHQLIFEAEQKVNIWNSIMAISTHFNRLRYLELCMGTNTGRVLSQHEMLLNAFENHTLSGVDELVESHLVNVMEIVDALRSENPSYFL